MAISKKLEVIYHNGQPDGIRSIRRNLSTMTTYVIPRPLLSEAKNISGINRPGIYYLINEDDGNKIVQLYIGQTRNGIARLDDHNRSKDFWNKTIMFLAESKTFTLDMISGLEKFAIIKAQESKRYKVCLLYTSWKQALPPPAAAQTRCGHGPAPPPLFVCSPFREVPWIHT